MPPLPPPLPPSLLLLLLFVARLIVYLLFPFTDARASPILSLLPTPIYCITSLISWFSDIFRDLTVLCFLYIWSHFPFNTITSRQSSSFPYSYPLNGASASSHFLLSFHPRVAFLPLPCLINSFSHRPLPLNTKRVTDAKRVNAFYPSLFLFLAQFFFSCEGQTRLGKHHHVDESTFFPSLSFFFQRNGGQDTRLLPFFSLFLPHC